MVASPCHPTLLKASLLLMPTITDRYACQGILTGGGVGTRMNNAQDHPYLGLALSSFPLKRQLQGNLPTSICLHQLKTAREEFNAEHRQRSSINLLAKESPNIYFWICWMAILLLVDLMGSMTQCFPLENQTAAMIDVGNRLPCMNCLRLCRWPVGTLKIPQLIGQQC